MSTETKTARSAPVIAIGLDGAEPSLIERWMAAGKLPNLRRLQEEGCWGHLARDRELFSENVWPDLLTGVDPSHHGMIAWSQLKPDSYEFEATDATTVFRNKLPFYARLSDPSRPVLIVDVPKSHPVEGLNGIQVFAWGAHSHVFRPASIPAEVYKDVESRFGVYTIRDKDEDDRSDPAYFQFLLDGLRSGAERRARMCIYLIEKYGLPDLLLTVFSETHTVGHRFWQFMDETHPDYDPAVPEAFKTAIFDVYQACDRAIGLLLDALPEHSTFFVFSVHGMAHNAHDSASMILLPAFLRCFNFPHEPTIETRRQGGLIQRVRDLSPVNFRNAFKHLLPLSIRTHVYMKRIGHFMQQDRWPEMRAFALPSASSGYIRFNLKGREPYGIVEPQQYDQLSEELTEELLALIEPRTGQQAVQQVHRRRDTHKGPFAEQVMPDLFVEWADLHIESLSSQRFGDIGHMPAARAASHRPRGIFVARGERLPRNRLLAGGHVHDLTPTLLSLLGEPIPEEMEGHPLLAGRLHVSTPPAG